MALYSGLEILQAARDGRYGVGAFNTNDMEITQAIVEAAVETSSPVIVSLSEGEGLLAASQREVFEAQVLLDEGKPQEAAQRAYSAMLQAARALAREKNQNVGDDPNEIVNEFKTHLVDTKVFWDPFAGAKFAQYLFRAHSEGAKRGQSNESAHQLIEEAQLFVDAAHQAYTRVGTAVP